MDGGELLIATLALAFGTFAFRFAGPVLRARVKLSKRTERLMALAAVVLLAPLVAASALTDGHSFAGFERAASGRSTPANAATGRTARTAASATRLHHARGAGPPRGREPPDGRRHPGRLQSPSASCRARRRRKRPHQRPLQHEPRRAEGN